MFFLSGNAGFQGAVTGNRTSKPRAGQWNGEMTAQGWPTTDKNGKK
jgi:hypothetical protein